jgi:hypothetical protein
MQGDKGDRLTPGVLTYFVVEASILWIGLNSFVKIEIIALGVLRLGFCMKNAHQLS